MRRCSLLALVFVILVGCGGDDDDTGYAPPEGVTLEGDADQAAIDAIGDRAPVAAPEEDVEGGIFMSRLDMHLTPAATVGQVNDALAAVQGGIVSMAARHPTVTIAFPRASDLGELRDTVQTLRAAPGIAFTEIAREAEPKLMPPAPAGDVLGGSDMDHLVTTRFPAAWNASRLATDGCAARKVTVIVPDLYEMPTSAGSTYARFPGEVPGYALLNAPSASPESHGFDVLTTLAGLFDATSPTGANPFGDCLSIEALNIGGLTGFQRAASISATFPAGKFILSYSIGFLDACRSGGCVDDEIQADNRTALERGFAAVDWKKLTIARWDDFLATVAAGNERNKPGTAIYRGFGEALYGSEMGIVTLPGSLFTFVTDSSAWDPQTPGFTTLKATVPEGDTLVDYVFGLGLDTAPPAGNVLLVGSTTTGAALDVAESSSSDSGADVHAVGEDVFSLRDPAINGTSFAAPQVAALASYLWLLSPDLEAQPSSVTRRVILDNVSRDTVMPLIDAYAAALSLDDAALPNATNAPVRFAILDQNDDLVFDVLDVEAYLAAYLDPVSRQPLEPVLAEHDRTDLNGDGYTGGSTRASFDLDRVGSTRFGLSSLGTVQQAIEGVSVPFDETALTDMQVLCYYAYSALYTAAQPDGRTTLLAPFCNPRARLVFIGRDPDGLHTIREDGSERVRISDMFGQVATWSPDGSQVAFQSALEEDGSSDLFVASADGSGVTNVTDTLGQDELNPSWSADGASLAFESNVRGEDVIELRVLDLGSGNVTILNPGTNGIYPRWSPDGTRIAFAGDDGGDHVDIFVMNADGTAPGALAPDPEAIDLHPVWSPDGTQLLFHSDRDDIDPVEGDHGWAIYVVNADGSGVQRLTSPSRTGVPSELPAWSPDARSIAYYDRDVHDLFVMNADGTGQTNVTSSGDIAQWSASWSPDGARLAFSRDLDLWLIGADGTNLVNITSSPGVFDSGPLYAPR